MIVIGLVLFITGIIIQSRNKSEYDRTATAIVGDTTCSTGPSPVGPSPAGPPCLTKYTFTVNDQKYDGSTTTGIEGNQVKIKYNSNDPSLNTIGDASGNNVDVILIYSGVGMIIFGVGVSVYSATRRPQLKNQVINNK